MRVRGMGLGRGGKYIFVFRESPIMHKNIFLVINFIFSQHTYRGYNVIPLHTSVKAKNIFYDAKIHL